MDRLKHTVEFQNIYVSAGSAFYYTISTDSIQIRQIEQLGGEWKNKTLGRRLMEDMTTAPHHSRCGPNCLWRPSRMRQ